MDFRIDCEKVAASLIGHRLLLPLAGKNSTNAHVWTVLEHKCYQNRPKKYTIIRMKKLQEVWIRLDPTLRLLSIWEQPGQKDVCNLNRPTSFRDRVSFWMRKKQTAKQTHPRKSSKLDWSSRISKRQSKHPAKMARPNWSPRVPTPQCSRTSGKTPTSKQFKIAGAHTNPRWSIGASASKTNISNQLKIAGTRVYNPEWSKDTKQCWSKEPKYPAKQTYQNKLQ